MLEQGDSGISANEPVAPRWRECNQANPIARLDEGVALVEAAHDLPLSFRSSRWEISRDRGEDTQ